MIIEGDAIAIMPQMMRGQRVISTPAVEKYATDMIDGFWYFTGSPVLFDADGELVDGQHRLTSILESGEPQTMVVIYGVTKEAIAAVDSGRRRTHADLLKMRGVGNHVLVAAIMGRWWNWMHGNYGQRSVARIANARYVSSIPSSMQKEAAAELCEKAYGITFEAAAKAGHRCSELSPGISSSIYALMWILLSGVGKDIREKFFHEYMVQPDSTEADYAINALRNRLYRSAKTEKLTPVQQLDMLIRTYNDWVEGKKLATVAVPRIIRHDILAKPLGWREFNDKDAA